MRTDRCDLLCLDAPAAERIPAGLPDPLAAGRLAAIAQPCADPTWLPLVLARDARQELCACDPTWYVDNPQNVVSHHPRRLRDAGMVESRREAQVVWYTLSIVGTEALEALARIEVTA